MDATASAEHSDPAITITPSQVAVSGGRVFEFFKRSIDLILSLGGGIVLSGPMAIIALAVWLDSDGPIVYRQERLGKDGHRFMICKFRTMRQDAESSGPQLAQENDQRCTRVGRFLRAHRLDELPQLWNIFRGEMSFVGPRPERAYYYRCYETFLADFKDRLAVKPGLTGLAQVCGAYDIQPSEKLSYDMKYIQNRSMALDLWCICQTVAVVLLGKGAR